MVQTQQTKENRNNVKMEWRTFYTQISWKKQSTTFPNKEGVESVCHTGPKILLRNLAYLKTSTEIFLLKTNGRGLLVLKWRYWKHHEKSNTQQGLNAFKRIINVKEGLGHVTASVKLMRWGKKLWHSRTCKVMDRHPKRKIILCRALAAAGWITPSGKERWITLGKAFILPRLML